MALKNKGFTIIELLVSGAIFAVILGATVSILVSSIKIQKYNLSHQQLMNQTSYAAEYIVRALRMAKQDNNADCIDKGRNYQIIGAGNSGLKFIDYSGNCLEIFKTDSDQIVVRNPSISISALPLISGDYEVTDLQFVVLGDEVDAAGDDTDSLQPRVTFFMEIQAKNLPDKPKINIQTTVSQRNLDRSP